MIGKNIPPCKICGQHFDDIFEVVDHLVDDENEPEFDPKLILPGGYQLMIGSLLRNIHMNAGNNRKVKDIVEHTYATLYAAETNPRKMKRFIEDLIITTEMGVLEHEINDFLSENDEKRGENEGE
jgi:hypothetical protein